MSSEEAENSKKPVGSAGGAARSRVLSAERKREIAKAAAIARWGAKATHKGNFKEEFGIDVECYVLDDPGKTAVISQRGMGAALGMGDSSGSRLPRFVNRKVMASHVGPELREKLEKPIVFQAFSGGPNSPPPSKVHGYDVTILVDICKAVVAAETAGEAVNPSVAKQAHIILSASAKAGIRGLVYALAGYEPTRHEVIEAFKLYVQEEAREYEKEFPDQLYAEWYRLYQLPKPERNKPWKFMRLTVDHVWHPLARSSGKVYRLTKSQRAENKADRWKKLHQFLSEVGVKALRTHLGQVLGIARISRTKEEYERHINQLFGEQPDMFDGDEVQA